MATWRYCPCCDEYTEWRSKDQNSRVEVCEGEEKMGRGIHVTQFWFGAYKLLNNTGLCYCELRYINDDGVGCQGVGCQGGGVYPNERYDKLVAAMELEMLGIFDPKLWKCTFPKRVAAFIQQR